MMIDKYGLIVQTDQDGGDTAARTGQWFLVKDNQPGLEIESAIVNLQPESGIWIRHPNYPDVKDCSRDQLDPIIMMLGHKGQMVSLRATFRAHLKRGFFYQNGDLPMVQTPGLYIRAFSAWYLYPVLLLTDVGFLFCGIENLFRKDPNDVDDNNTIMRFVQALKYPTLFSYLGRKFYSLTRHRNYGNILKGETSAVMGALAYYHRVESNGNPEIAEAYRPYVERYFT